MADVSTNWIDFYISLAPVVQTGIWAGVSVAALLTLRKPLRQLAEELVRRVNQGDKVSTPWLSIERRQEREREVVAQVAENLRSELNNPDKDIAVINSIIDESKIDKIINIVSSRFIYFLFSSSDFNIKSGKDVKVSLYVTEWGTVSEFLNDSYISAIESGVEIPIWTYGRYWHFRNERTGKYISKAGKGQMLDGRPFSVLDVAAGDVLVAERIRQV